MADTKTADEKHADKAIIDMAVYDNLESIAAVIFDMDGVIINGMPYHAQAWQETFASVGLDITAEEVYEREGEAGPAAVAHFLKERGMDASLDEVRDLIGKKERRFKEIAKVEVFEGVPELLQALRRQGKRLALVTGTARHELEIILPVEIKQQFEIIITGDSVQRGKPDPEPYQKALAALGLTPEKALVIENAPLGIQSARAAGLDCLAVETSLACERLGGARQCFPNLPA
ncbi:HAD family phosphatase, partial [candidate division FCPU426 bacterium]|nr:HAD family phosphatase [candidate division FCPU426 bacterium]